MDIISTSSDGTRDRALTFHDSEEESVAFQETINSSVSQGFSVNAETKNPLTYSRFGLRPWGHKLVKKPQSKSIEENEKQTQTLVKIEAVIWVVVFAWWMSSFFLLASLIMYLSYFGRKYSILCYKIAIYILYPFEKYVVEKRVFFPFTQSLVVS